MREPTVKVIQDHLPFYITGPGESDILFGAVTIALIAIVVGFGALYFTIQSIPDRIVKGTGKAQMQVVGLLGLISLFTMNNLYWIAAILLAAIRIPNFMAPLTQIAQSARSLSKGETTPGDRDTGKKHATVETGTGAMEADALHAERATKVESSRND
jgi:hypothetical protein